MRRVVYPHLISGVLGSRFPGSIGLSSGANSFVGGRYYLIYNLFILHLVEIEVRALSRFNTWPWAITDLGEPL